MCPHSELFWSAFSGIRAEYGEILRVSPYSIRIWENVDQNNFEYGHFLSKCKLYKISFFPKQKNSTSSVWRFCHIKSVQVERVYTPPLVSHDPGMLWSWNIHQPSVSDNNRWYYQSGEVVGIYFIKKVPVFPDFRKNEKWCHYSTSLIKEVSFWKF